MCAQRIAVPARPATTRSRAVQARGMRRGGEANYTAPRMPQAGFSSTPPEIYEGTNETQRLVIARALT
jgi:alkylation response protein AidB-like acyl-CoA dehydrogenase